MKLRYDKDHKLISFSEKPYFTEELTPDDLILDVGMNEPKDKDVKAIIDSLDEGDKAQLKKVMTEWINVNPVSSDELAMQHGAKRLNKLMKFSVNKSMNQITTKVDLKTNEGKVIPAGSNISYGWIPGDPNKNWVMFIYWNGKTYTKNNMNDDDIEELTSGSMNTNFSERIQSCIDRLKDI